MKKLILIILMAVASAMFTNAKASTKVTDAKNNLSIAQKLSTNSKYLKLKPTYYVFSDNGSLWLLTIYDNGNSTLTYLGPIIIQ
jgi:hypothetical protein